MCKSRRRCCRIESFDAWLRKGAFDIMWPDGTKVDEIAVCGWKLDENGIRQIPDAPGLGLTLDRNVLVSYTDGELRL